MPAGFSSRQEMVNTFERDLELATLTLDTKHEIERFAFLMSMSH